MADAKEQIERYKNIIGIVAILAGGLFFGVKALDGWLSVNMDVTASVQRTAYRQGRDVLAVTVDLKKGERGSVKLMDGSVRISCLLSEGNSQIKALHGLERILVIDDSLRWHQVAARPYSISAGEKLQLATVFVVPSDAILFVDVSLVGRPTFLRRKRKPSQWNAATISLPDQSRVGSPTDLPARPALSVC